MKEGYIIEWVNDDFNHRSILTVITKICRYTSFKIYLTTEKIQH